MRSVCFLLAGVSVASGIPRLMVAYALICMCICASIYTCTYLYLAVYLSVYLPMYVNTVIPYV